MPQSTAFDLDRFLALPRVSGLDVSPDGRTLVTAAALPDDEGTAFVSSLWALDPHGAAAPRRLTYSPQGERDPRFAPDGSLLFASARPGPDGEREDDARTALWRLPADAGEAMFVAAPPAGVKALRVARSSGRVVLATALHPDTDGWAADRETERRRRDRKITAQLVDDFPVRVWDAWYGPRQRRLFAQTAAGEDQAFANLAPDAGYALEDQSFDVARDGSAVTATWRRRVDDLRDMVAELVVIPVTPAGAPGPRRVLLSEHRVGYEEPAFSPDGRQVACVRKPLGIPQWCPDWTLVVVDVATGTFRDVLEGFDRWPYAPVWAPDGDRIYFVADDDGHAPAFSVDVATGRVRRLAATGAFSDLTPAPDGGTLYALRSHLDEPPQAVALDPDASDQEPRRIPSPGALEAREAVGHHRLDRVEAAAGDGARVPGWLLRPDHGDPPPPLVVLIHGGPHGTWNAWHWRWNAHLLVARGWAVLMPDPGLSTGYGLDYAARGWGRWGAEPYTDLMALAEAVAARDDVDGTRVAAMGGSFGGYLANWVAGHTDRFDAIMTHASLWDLESYHGAADLGPLLENEFGDRYREAERYREWSPVRFVDRIRTPMLVIQGEHDYRVPTSQGLALWTDLRRHGVEAYYLHFHDESHWITSPQHVRVWYEVVFAFLDHHVLGKPFDRPPLI